MTRLQCGKVWKTSPTTRHHPPAQWRINNWQTIWMNSIAVLKKTPHTCPEHLSTQPLIPPATPLSPHLHFRSAKMMCVRSSGSRRGKKQQAQIVLHQHPIPKKPIITGLNDYRPVALMSVVTNSFEKLVLAHLKDITGPLLDPLQFAYRANRSVDDAVNMGLHFILQHLDRPGTYVRILFVDFSLAFNTIISNLLLPKLTQLSMPTSICQWIASFLTDRQQLVKLGKFSSSTHTISTRAPQGCVLSPLLFSLYTNDCTSNDPSVKLLKFADDTTLIGLIQDGDESAPDIQLFNLLSVSSHNNLELNTPSLNCCRLVDATEHWAPERPDTGTVSSLRQHLFI